MNDNLYDEAFGPRNPNPFRRHRVDEWAADTMIDAVELAACLAPNRVIDWEEIF